MANDEIKIDIPPWLNDPFEAPLDYIGLNWPLVVCFGGGLNSTALLVKWTLDGNGPVDRILFADTGGERPETYEHIRRFSDWLVVNGQPPIEVIRKGGRQETLEEDVLRRSTLPSIAFGGFKTCSIKYKVQPQEQTINKWEMARRFWKNNNKVIKIVGYGYEEQKRIAKARLEDEKYYLRFPLNEWKVDRDGCVEIVKRAGLPVPGKSSCFFCPSTKKEEILALPPELKARAIRIEVQAKEKGLKSIKGLGRYFSWQEFLDGKQDVPEAPAESCMYCVDDNGDSKSSCASQDDEEL